MKIVAKTDKGMVRDSNQDAYAVGELPGEVVWAELPAEILHRLWQ